MNLTPEETAIADAAFAFAKANRKAIALRRTEGFDEESEPVAVFMAGSPGPERRKLRLN
jgi:hypothetical protein